METNMNNNQNRGQQGGQVKGTKKGFNWKVAGIIAGGLGLAALAGGIVYKVRKKKAQKEPAAADPADNNK